MLFSKSVGLKSWAMSSPQQPPYAFEINTEVVGILGKIN